MKNQENNLDALLRQKLDSLEGDVSPHDWQAISERLDNGKKPGAGFFSGIRKYLALLLLVLLTGIGIGYFMRSDDKQSIKNSRATASGAGERNAKNGMDNAVNPGSGNSSNDNNSNSTNEGKNQNTGNSGTSGNETTNNSQGLNSNQTEKINTTTSEKQLQTVDTHKHSKITTGTQGGRQNAKTTIAGMMENDIHAVYPPSNARPVSSSSVSGKKTKDDDNTKNPEDNNGLSTQTNASGLTLTSKKNALTDKKASLPEKKTQLPISTKSVDSNSDKKEVDDESKMANADSMEKKNHLAKNAEKPDSIAPDKKIVKALASNLKKNHLSLYLSYAPEYSCHSLAANPAMAGQTHEDYLNTRSSQEKGGMGYSFNAGLEYNLPGNFTFQSGVGYSRIVETVNYNFVNNKIPVVDSATGKILGYIQIPQGTRTQYSHTNTYNYINIPVILGYRMKFSQRFSMLVKGGGSFLFLSSANGEMLKPDDLTLESISDSRLLRNSNFNFYGSAEGEYSLNNFISLCLGMNYHQLQNSIYTSNASARLKSSGVGVIFTAKLKLF